MTRALLVADIGGTNARFAIAELSGERVTLLHRDVMRVEDFAGPADAANAFLKKWNGPKPQGGVVAVAGPIEADIVFTNSPWRFQPAALAKEIGVAALKVVNDFAAMSRGAVEAPQKDLRPVEGGGGLAGAPVAVLGPGTGLGLGLVIDANGKKIVIATEGGHAAFAPQTEKEIEVLRFLQREDPFVSYEEVLSGRGLVNLDRAVRAIAGMPPVTKAPEEITASALAGNDQMAREATEMFCAILGTFAGDAALITGARGGVILAGGILPKIEPILKGSAFNARFVLRPPMRAYLEAIPVRLLDSDVAALIGAALLA